jgi:hypothetical protein
MGETMEAGFGCTVILEHHLHMRAHLKATKSRLVMKAADYRKAVIYLG